MTVFELISGDRHSILDTRLTAKLEQSCYVVNQGHQNDRSQEISQLERADTMVADLFKLDFRIGYDLCLAEQLDLPNLVLVNANLRLPEIIKDSPKLKLVYYQTTNQALLELDSNLKKLRN